MKQHNGDSLLDSVREAMGAARLRRPLGKLAAAGVGALTPLMALANPTGGQVVAGSASITTPNGNRMVIDQTSQNAAINWQQFSVGANQYVQFIQPNSSAVVLNRVISNDPSRIFGNISANGQVFLVNPNGVFFAPGSSLDAAGILVSTLDIKNNDFMQGNYVFAKGADAPDAVILNQGRMNVTRNGYVVLAGDYVENDGRIQAQTGRVYLAAGANATLTFDSHQLISYSVDGATLARLSGVVNAGDIVATGGAVVMTGDVANALTATAVNNQGFIAAKSIQDHSGTIILAATGGELVNSGTLDASATVNTGNVAGGTIIIHGNGLTQLLPTSNINAAGGGNGKGGFIDLSGHNLGVRGSVTNGKGGTLLLDPASINITAGSSTGGSSTNPNKVGINFIATQLNAGNNVEIVASNNVIYTGAAGQTLLASNSAGVGKQLTIEVGAITGCGPGGVCASPGILPGVTSLNFGNITLTGLTLNIKSSLNIQTANGNVTVDGITAQGGISIGGGKITINGNLAANASVNINSTPNAPGGFIHAAGKTISGTRVDLSLGAASYGGSISVGAINAISHAGASVSQSVGSSADTIKVGSVTAPDISIGITGKHDLINVGPITAVNPNGAATVHINEFVQNGGSGAVNVNGNITVSGKPGSSLGGLTKFDLPIAAGLFINVGGSGSADPHSMKVSGAINITAHGGAYSAGNCECGTPKRLQSGTGGAAVGFITVAGSHGAASVTGDITAKGPDAFVGVQAHGVTVQNISVTGSGHHITRSMGPFVTSGAYASSNSAGQANLILGTVAPTGSYGGPGISATVKAGNIIVSGKGAADAGLFASNVSAGNITVTATAASGKITKDTGQVTYISCSGVCANANSSGFYRGIGGATMRTGTLNVGRADIEIAANSGNGFGSGAQAANIKVGDLSATGVGRGFISLDAKSIQTLGLTVAATKGTEIGNGSSQSGTSAVTVFAHTFNINGGEAGIKIRSGNSASHSSGVLTQNGGPVTIGGAISATGPRANVDVKGKTITVGGAVSVTGSGGTLTSTTVVTGPNGGFSTSFSGPGRPTSLNLQGGASGSVAVAGKTSVKGPGLVGMIILGGTVSLHGLSGSASAVKTYTAKDTRVSPTQATFTGGSLAVVVDQVGAGSKGPVFAPASDTGNVTLTAKGDVDLASRIQVKGGLTVQAGGAVFGSSHNVVSHFNATQNQVRVGNNSSGGGPSPGALPTLAIGATSAVTMTAGGSIDLTKASVNSSKQLSVTAGTGLAINGATLGAPVVQLQGAAISNGGSAGTITTGSAVLKATSGKVSLAGETLSVGTGKATVSAGGGIDLTGATITAGSVSMVTAGSIGLSGAKLTASKVTQLVADKNIVLNGANITAGTLTVTASGSIQGSGTGGAVNAGAMAMVAGKSINMSGTQLTIGNGSISSVHGDAQLLLGLAEAGIAPAASNPNGAFIAGGSVTLGGLKLTGSYLLLQGTAVSVLGPVSVPAGTLVQVVPFDPTVPISIEDAPGAASVLTLAATSPGFFLTNVGFISQFPGATVAVGSTDETGDATLGANGPIDIGDTNLIIDTTGTITGLSTVTSTGLVNSLLAILSPPVPPPTAGEIDPSASNTAPPNKKTGNGDVDTGTGGGTGGTIIQDTGTASVCH